MSLGHEMYSPLRLSEVLCHWQKQLTLLPHVRATKCVLSTNVLVCQLGLVREAL